MVAVTPSVRAGISGMIASAATLRAWAPCHAEWRGLVHHRGTKAT